MADDARLVDLLDELNTALVGVTPFKLALVDPATVELLSAEENARYMSKETFDRLAENIRQDGNLSSVPLCWRRPEGTLLCLSGNHRLLAAREAGIRQVLVLYTDADLTESERLARQLSGNSLVGQDNPQKLAELWQRVDAISWKVYSGLDDARLKTLPKMKVIRPQDAKLLFEEVRLLFVPAEAERIEETLKKLGDGGRRWAASYADFDRFFETLLRYKQATGILNTATAIRTLTEIAEEWLARQERPTDGG